MRPLRVDGVEETQDDEVARSGRTVPDEEKEEQETDHVAARQGEHASAEERTHARRRRNARGGKTHSEWARDVGGEGRDRVWKRGRER